VIFAVMFFLLVTFFVGELVCELRTGKLLARGWKIIERRQDNPMLYWSSMALKSFVALFLMDLWVLTFLGRND